MKQVFQLTLSDVQLAIVAYVKEHNPDLNVDVNDVSFTKETENDCDHSTETIVGAEVEIKPK